MSGIVMGLELNRIVKVKDALSSVLGQVKEKLKVEEQEIDVQFLGRIWIGGKGRDKIEVKPEWVVLRGSEYTLIEMFSRWKGDVEIQAHRIYSLTGGFVRWEVHRCRGGYCVLGRGNKI